MLIDREDAKHGLKEVAALDLVVNGEVKKGISVSATQDISDMYSTITLCDTSPSSDPWASSTLAR